MPKKRRKSMIQVKMIAKTDIDPVQLASYAALLCYQAELPEMGKIIDVENRLFKVGHHTTIQHSSFTFSLEGIAVGDITFGMHMASPFYNSDQRSGRFCAKMFMEPDFEKIESYISGFWPEISPALRGKTLKYIRKCVELYQGNITRTAEIAKDFLKAERPYANEKYLEQNAPKIAQEQMRMFIPIIFPTAFAFTVNLSALVAMYESAWTPAMKYVTERMAKELLGKFPELKFMFDSKRRRHDEWAMKLPSISAVSLKYKQGFKLLDIVGEDKFKLPNHDLMHPVDKLHFCPEMMNNSIGKIWTQVEISAATMGQDQRHRTIGRGTPSFTGNFYVPPVVKALGLMEEANKLMRQWVVLGKKLPKTLAMIIAPYGAMVSYEKTGDFNAIAHEQAKRLCWCAQEEIYHAGRALRLAIKKRNSKSRIIKTLEPHCYSTGKCAEGGRYCGRDIKLRKNGEYFPERKV